MPYKVRRRRERTHLLWADVLYLLYLGHHFLTTEGILHRDISPGSILIIPNSSERGYHGVLIDLDFAVKEYNRVANSDERSVSILLILLLRVTPGLIDIGMLNPRVRERS